MVTAGALLRSQTGKYIYSSQENEIKKRTKEHSTKISRKRDK